MKLTEKELNAEIGKKYQRYTIVAFSHMSAYGDRMYRCDCDCGNSRVVNWNKLTKARTVSCGCYASEVHSKLASSLAEKHLLKHGHRRGKRSRTYQSWMNMKNRVKPGYFQSKYYYDIGITMCDRWGGEHGFNNFLEDMGERPDGMTIDRINPNKGYSPDNCRWADAYLQSHNTRKNFIQDGTTNPKRSIIV